MNEELPPLRERLGRTGCVVIGIVATVVLIAPIVSVFYAGSRVEDTIEWLPFVLTASLTWLGISVVVITAAVLWLWLTWDSPDPGEDDEAGSGEATRAD